MKKSQFLLSMAFFFAITLLFFGVGANQSTKELYHNTSEGQLQTLVIQLDIIGQWLGMTIPLILGIIGILNYALHYFIQGKEGSLVVLVVLAALISIGSYYSLLVVGSYDLHYPALTVVVKFLARTPMVYLITALPILLLVKTTYQRIKLTRRHLSAQ